MPQTQIGLIKCTSYEPAAVQDAVRRSIDLLGGIGRFVKPGERILLKPNLLSAKEPERAITTHPEIVRAVVRLVREAGAHPMIGDSPGGAIKGVDRVWEKTGMKRISVEEGVPLVNFETGGVVEKAIDHRDVHAIHLSRHAMEADGIINLPKIKTHSFMTFTCAIKNFFGCIPGLRKAEYHKMSPHPDDFGRLLAEIFLQVKGKVRFTLADGIVGMEGNGPSSGDIRKMDLLAVSADALALDSFLALLLGFKPSRIATLRYLADRGAGEWRTGQIELLGDTPSSFNVSGFRFPATWYLQLVPRRLVKLLGRLFWLRPEIVPEICQNCLLCVKSCPVHTIRRQDGGKKPVVDPSACINCLCCHELCPYNAIALKSSFLARRLIRH
jgi:uncharacterized protein (DUF362 family)/Pyruvate/2-oxoacid:ferredoxin oxidoreductase delta subunit